MRILFITLSVVLCFAWAGSVAATSLSWAIDENIQEANWASTAGMDGLEFTPNTNIAVTALGWYDDTFTTSDGLANPHQVGIWNVNTTQLVASATVPAGTAATKTNHFRFIDLDQPVALDAGTLYVVAGIGGDVGDPNHLVIPDDDLIIDSRISIGAWRYGGSVFSFPSSSMSPSTRIMGPSFMLIPEPTAILLFSLGSLAVMRRKR